MMRRYLVNDKLVNDKLVRSWFLGVYEWIVTVVSQ